LKKSPTGSDFTHCALKKNRATTGKETQRERAKLLIWLSAFNEGGIFRKNQD